jgi:DNA-binding protein Fis
MSSIATQPIPKNLREQMVQRISTMSEQDVVELYELVLLNEKIRLRQAISDQAERENAAGLWTDLPELIRAYRARKKSA